MTEESHLWGFEKSLLIKVSIIDVWPHIGEPCRLSRWWCPPPTVKISFDPRPGAKYTERYSDRLRSYEVFGEVAEFDPPQRLTIRRNINGGFGHSDQVDITLNDLGSRTQVQLNHSFDGLLPHRRGEAYDFYADGWSFSLELLEAEVVRAVRNA